MNKNKKYLLFGLLVVTLVVLSIYQQNNVGSEKIKFNYADNNMNLDNPPEPSTTNNYDNIQAIFDKKIED
ncbi:MAG: hypothetical protein ACXABO_21670, partial [Promethearchaeota archaeon]